MECCKGVLTAFGLGCTPHVQRQARTDRRLRAYTIDVAVPLAIAPVTACHGLGRRGEQRLSETRQGLGQRGGTELLQRVTAGGEPLDAPPPLGPLGQGRLGPTAPIA
jgi:hypothetical protein